MPTEVGIRELRSSLSDYIDRARDGEVVTVTRRGTPVARIVPTDQSSAMARLAAAGVIEWNGTRPSLPRPVRPIGEGPTASDYVLEGRR